MRRNGQSLIEVLISLAIGILFVVGAAAIIAPSLRTITQVGRVEEQAQLATELMENAKSWSQGNWNSVLALATGTANGFYFNASTSPFQVVAGRDSIVLSLNGTTGTYYRYFYLSDVYRTASGTIASTPSGNSYDPSTKLLTAVVSAASSTSPTTTYSIYLARYPSNTTPASWSSLTNLVVNSSGSLQLASGAGSSTYQSSGNAISVISDTGATSALNSIVWNGSLPAGTNVTFQVAVSNNSGGPWIYVGSNGLAGSSFSGGNPGSSVTLLSTSQGYALFSGYRYFRIRINLYADSSSTYTPTISQTIVNWSP